MRAIRELKKQLSDLQENMESTGHQDYIYLVKLIDVVEKLIVIVESNDRVLTDHLRDAE